METMTTVVYGVQANSPAPLFRVGGSVVASCRPVAGLLGQASGFAASGSQVQSVAGVAPAGAAQALGLRGYAGLVRLAEQAVRLVEQARTDRRQVLLAQIDGEHDGIFSSNGSDNGNTDGSSGSKPMTPWGYRTSSPPG